MGGPTIASTGGRCAVAHRSADDPYCWLVDLDAVLAETERMLSGTSPLVQWRARVLAELEDVLSL